MSVLNQKTINKNIHLSGVGLHNGLEVNLILKPAEPNTGERRSSEVTEVRRMPRGGPPNETLTVPRCHVECVSRVV